jgi:pimeloyl-ACP methyl ester carboxylesterase
MTHRTRIALILAILIALPLAWLAMLRDGYGATDLATVRARYAAPPSRLVTVDGVELHVREEGQGPPVVMLHGSILNLHEWDPMIDRMKGRYRIIRLDWPPYGVSGLDPKGQYTTARAADLLAGLMDQMGLQRFHLVATSNGVNVALDFNARYPDRLDSLALSILPLERPSQTRKVDTRIRALGWFHKNFLPDYHSRYWYRLIIEDTTRPGYVPPDELVEMMYQTNNLPGAAQRQRDYIDSNTRLFKTSDVGAGAAAVRAPVLIQWCALDTVISQSAQATVARFSNAAVQLIEYPDVGHFPMWEDTERFTQDLLAFLDRIPPTTP